MQLINGFRLRHSSNIMDDLRAAIPQAQSITDLRRIAHFYGLGIGYICSLAPRHARRDPNASVRGQVA